MTDLFPPNPLHSNAYSLRNQPEPLRASQSEQLPTISVSQDAVIVPAEPPVSQDATEVKTSRTTEQSLHALLEQHQPVNAVALRSAFPQFEGLLDGDISDADIQQFGSLLEGLEQQLTPDQLQNTLLDLGRTVRGGEGNVPQLLEILQQALPIDALDAALIQKTESQYQTENAQHLDELQQKALTLVTAEIKPSQSSPAHCAAAYGKLAARQKDCLTQLESEISRLDQQLLTAEPEQKPGLEKLRDQLCGTRDLLGLSQQISTCLSRQAGVSKNYPIDIRISGYAAINDLSSVQLRELQNLGQQLRTQIAVNSNLQQPELLLAAARTAQIAETVGISLNDPAFREASRSLGLDTNPAAVALQYSQHLKLVANGEAELAGKAHPHKQLGWYHPRFGTRTEDFIQVRLNGPKNQQKLRELVDLQLQALTSLSVDELRSGKGEKIRTEIRAELKSRLISERSIESFMSEIDTRLQEVSSLQPTLTTADVSVPQGKALSQNEIAAFSALYQDLVNSGLKSSSDPTVQKYVKALELIQLQPEAGDGARYLENSRAQAEQLLKESVDSPAVKKIFESARQQAVLLACDPAYAAKGSSARSNFFDMMPNGVRQAQAQARIEQLVTFIEGAADQGIDVTEQLSMLQAMAPEKFQQLSKQTMQQEMLEQIAEKALADPKLQPKIAAGQREMLKQVFWQIKTPQAEDFRLALSKLSDQQVLNFCQQLKAEGSDRADGLVKLCKRYFGDNIQAEGYSKLIASTVHGPRLGGAISLGGVMLGLLGDGIPNGAKIAEDSSAFLKALGESTLNKATLESPKMKGVLGALGLAEGSAKLVGLLQSGKFESKDWLTIAEGTAGVIEGGISAYSGVQAIRGVQAEQLLSKRGEMFLKGVGKLAAVASIVVDSQASVKAHERKDYVGQAAAVVQVGAGTAGLIATCAGSGPAGWVALAVYGAAMGVDMVFGMSEDAEKVMDLRNSAGISQQMQERYNRVATFVQGGQPHEHSHEQILANIAKLPEADRNAFRTAVIHMKLEEAQTSDYDEDLIHGLINQAHGEGEAAFNGLIDQMGTRMLGYVLEKDEHLQDLLGKLLSDKLDVGPDSKFAQLLTGLAENHNDEILTQVLTSLKSKYPQKAAALAPETLIGVSDKLMKGQTDSSEQRATFQLLHTFASDTQFSAVMKSGEASRFFKDLSSELEYGQTAKLLSRALSLDIRQNRGTQTTEHLFKMAEFGVKVHNQHLYTAVNDEVSALAKAHTGIEANQIQRFGAWLNERHPQNDEELLKAIFVPAEGQIFDERTELSQYQREQGAARLLSRQPDVMAEIRQENASIALRELAKLESSQVTLNRVEPLLLTLMQSKGLGDASFQAQSQHQLARMKQLEPSLNLTALQTRANDINAQEVVEYREFVQKFNNSSVSDLVKQLQNDGTLRSYLSRAW